MSLLLMVRAAYFIKQKKFQSTKSLNTVIC